MTHTEETLEALESLRAHPGWRLLVGEVKRQQERELLEAVESRTLDALAEHRGHLRGMQDTLELVEIVRDSVERIPGEWVQRLREHLNKNKP